jgi:Transposase DDE domain group 1
MPQGLLPYKYEEEKSDSGITSLAGLPLYLDLASALGLADSITSRMHVTKGPQGWSDEQVILSLILLNLAGGDSVDDVNILEKDGGLSKIFRRIELKGFTRKERRAKDRQWRKERLRSFPSPSPIFRYLEAFHDAEEEKKREKGKAFIPAPNEHLINLMKVNRDFILSTVQCASPKEATLDMDATLIETLKRSALFSYKHCKAYQPFNTWWAEQEMILHTEFRDGNVPAGHEQLRVFKEALDQLPPGVEKVYLRSDTAGYQHDLLKYCEGAGNERFGRIEFAIGADVTPEFKKAVAGAEEWRPLYKEGKETGKEWTETSYVPNAIGHSKNDPEYRYLATREPLKQDILPGMEGQLSFPFPVMTMDTRRYKIFGIVTNRDMEGDDLIRWHYKRSGKSEEAHSIMKEDLAGGRLPSGKFGENAAWWWIMVLAFNLHSAMKRLVLRESWTAKRMKAIRFSLISLPGRVMSHARELVIRIAKGHPSLATLLTARQKIMELAEGPSG